MYPFLSLREYLWLYESRGWHFTVHHINVLFLFFNFFYFSTDLIRVAMTSKVRRLKHFHHSYKGLTWATAVSSSRTFLSSMSVLTMWCSTTWFGGSVTAPLFCVKEKILIKIQDMCLTSLSVLDLTCFINIDAFELGFWYSEVQQLLVSIMIIFPSPWTYFTNKCREGNILSFKGYYNR